MSVAKGIRAGAAYVELYAKNNQLVKGLKAAEQKLKAFGAGIRSMGVKLLGLGSVLAAPLAGAVMKFAAVGDNLDKMALRTGASTNALSELGFAAEQSGSNLEAVEAAMKRMQKTVVQAASGSQAAADALANVGLGAGQLITLSPDQQLEAIADGLANIQNPAARAAAAMEIFGKSGTGLLPMMADGARGIRELRAEASGLGLSVDPEQAKAAAEFTDALNRVKRAAGAVVFAVGPALAPAITELMEAIKPTVVAIGKWIRNNKAIVVTFAKFAIAVMAGGAALIVLGTSISGIGAALGIASGLIIKFGAGIGSLGGLLASLLSPIALVAVGITGLAGYFIYAGGVGGKAISWLAGVLGDLKDSALKSFQGMSDALAAGDIGLAANVLWLTLKMEWIKGVAELKNIWTGFKTWFQQTLIDWETDFQVGTAKAVSTSKQLSAGFDSGLKKIGSAISAGVSKSLMQAGNLITTGSAALTREQEARLGDIIGGVIDSVNTAQAERDSQVQAAEDQEDKAVQDATEKAKAEKQQLESQGAAEIAEANAAIANAKAELEKSLAEAQQRRKEFEAMKKPDPFKPDFKLDLEGLDTALETSQRKIESSGTFNAMAALGLGANSLTERTANASEQTAANTRKLLQEAQHGGLVFS